MAAFCAATSRLGCTSVARMLPDTSMARMMVCWLEGRVTTATGRAAASSMAAMASRNSTGGMWRRIVWPAPMASLHDGQRGIAQRHLLLAAQQPARTGSTSSGRASSSQRNCGPEEVHGRVSSRVQAARLQVGGHAAAGRQPGAPLAHLGEADDGVDQVAVGGQFERVDAGAHEAFAQLGFALRGNAREALAKAARRACRPAAARRFRRRAWSAGPGRAGPAPAGRAGARRPPRGAARAAPAAFPSRVR